MAIGQVPISSYGNQIGAMDKVSAEQLNNKGTYYQPAVIVMQDPPQRKKQGSFIGFLAKLVLTAAAACGAAYGAKKLIPGIKDFTCAEKLSGEAKFADKAKHIISKSGEWVETNIVKKAGELFEKMKTKKTEAKA